MAVVIGAATGLGRVNNVGGSRRAKIWEMAVEDWDFLGQPIEVDHPVLFLASDEASDVTGHTLAVAGGR